MQYQQGSMAALACIRGEKIRGVVRFCRQKDGVQVTAEIFGLSDGFHGFHIHTGKSCGGDQFADSMGHFNPQNVPHPDHVGDLPPLLSCGGVAKMTVLTGRFRICDVIGKTVVVHSKADDFVTQPAGNSGTKIACGVIEKC